MTHAPVQVEVQSGRRTGRSAREVPSTTTEPVHTDSTTEVCAPAPTRRDLTAALFHQLRRYPPGHPHHSRIREEVVRLNMPLVGGLARRFQNRGEPLEDLEQVAVVGLLHAIDRFDVRRGVAFSTFATPTVAGEIKRYFRDHGWMVRVPRTLQEMRLALTAATPVIAQELGRSPTVAELAERLDVTEGEVTEGLAAGNAYSALSLDLPNGEEGGEASLADGLGEEETAYDFIEDCVSLKPLLEELPDRERRILHLRFFEELTQTEIAEQVGISQMHVSRLLTRTLTQLRAGLSEGERDVAPAAA